MGSTGAYSGPDHTHPSARFARVAWLTKADDDRRPTDDEAMKTGDR
jgi:hypothetical protein